MLSLAPLRYARVTAPHGGPIRVVEAGATSVMGQRVFQASAYLDDRIRVWGRDNVLYGDPDGTGTARSPAVARHIAVSEALERWAHRHTLTRGLGHEFGFDVDPSSNGMAAFPGLWASQARTPAYTEAAERHALLAWWNGAALATPRVTPWPDVDCWQIENRLSRHSVVLLHTLADEGWHAYATAAAATVAEAQGRAASELVRSQFVLRRRARWQAASVPCPPVRNLFERRCLYFASDQGYEVFLKRMATKPLRSFEAQRVYDGPVPGPWDEFTSVWRVAYQPIDPDFLRPEENYFFW